MDKLSTKLKLVRSQSMGVGMGGGGDKLPNMRSRGHANQASMSEASNGRPASIVLLDERRLEMHIQPRLFAGELLDLVASHIQLKEKEYFGLAVVDENGHYTWLQLDRKILDHDLPRKPQTLVIHFLVKFFIESICHLAENKTIELFYLQARSLIFRGSLEVEADIIFQLAALSLQASYGDHIDEVTTRNLARKSPILPATVLKDHPSLTVCEDQVIGHYVKTRGQTRGQAIVNYMTIVESMPTYGVHYFEVLDKRGSPWWLGLSCRGIAQYEAGDRKVPVRVFQWKQLENLYFRDKKFSIEVHDAKRVVQTLSSFNLYEDVNKDTKTKEDEELAEAITDATTQVSLSRRSYNPGNIHVYVWFGKTQALTKCIWQSAISQHQFYLDRKQAKMRPFQLRTLKEIARDLTRSSLSLSSNSSSCSVSNLSQSLSESNPSLLTASKVSLRTTASEAATIAVGGAEKPTDEQLEETKRLKAEMLAALKARREALEAKLQEKNGLLKELCIKEGELTGVLPPEIPLKPGEPAPTIRRRVGTEFKLSEHLLKSTASNEDGGLRAALELELEIQNKITAAVHKIASDLRAPKSVRKQRKTSYQASLQRLGEIETKLNNLKTSQKRLKQPRRGISVPADLDENPEDDDVDDEVDAAMSPRSCPTSPRKGAVAAVPLDTVSLHSPQRPSRTSTTASGYIPSSVYLRSSYRTKQFPTLSSSPGIDANLGLPLSPPMMAASKTASPYRSKYEVPNLQLDSPVGLYNCPQQRTSQAFSSMDDLDALTAANSAASIVKRPLPQYQSPGASRSKTTSTQVNHRFVLGQAREVMARVEAATAAVLNNDHTLTGMTSKRSLAQRELPALPLNPVSKAKMEARSMEDLDSLEAAGLHGRSKLHFREVKSEAVSHNLHNTEEYPPHEMTSSKFRGRHHVEGGPYPLPPSSRSSTTLLPGQTYPEQPVKPITSLQDVFYHRDNFRMAAMPTSSNTNSSLEKKNSLSKNELVIKNNESPPPPLYPKQYHAVVEQRRRSGLDRPTAVAVPAIPPATAIEADLESPAVDRRIKPKAGDENSFEGDEKAGAFKFVPYVETTKPFEMSDFYKYSTKYNNSKKSTGSESSSSTVSNENNNGPNPPPELPAKNSPAKVGGGAVPAPPPPPPPPTKKAAIKATSEVTSNGISDSFSDEMLEWYKSTTTPQQQSGLHKAPKPPPPVKADGSQPKSNKPATLV